MESILQSKEARRIPIKLIVSILEDKEIFSSEEAMKMCEIREMFAHRVNLKSIEEDTEKLLSVIKSLKIPHPIHSDHYFRHIAFSRSEEGLSLFIDN